jgi:CRISPR-associated protein (TIGR02584 family)
MSPAVVTETLYALLTQDVPFVPDEIHVVTTLVGKKKMVEELLEPNTGQFHQLLAEYLPGQAIRFDADTVHVIGQTRRVAPMASFWAGLGTPQAPQFEEVELKDITTEEENRAAADTIYRVMRELKAAPGTRLHASVAGGRKSMSFYMGHAFSLLAEPQDTLSHVLVSEPFEHPDMHFYYPPRTPVNLQFHDRAGVLHTHCTDQAHVNLAELSVLKLGGLLGKDWPPKAQASFDFAVRLAQAALVPPEVCVVLEDEKGWLEVCGETVELSPQQFTVFALYALARCHEDELSGGAALVLEDLPAALWESLGEDFKGGQFNASTRNFNPVRSKIQDALREVVGAVAQHFTIEAGGDKKKAIGTNRPVFLKTPATCIKHRGLQGWWRQLRAVLQAQAPA